MSYISSSLSTGTIRPKERSSRESRLLTPKPALTSYNAACDFHHIITELKKVMPAKWMMTGASKGGIATMVQSMYFPEDANVFVPQIAPVMSSLQEDCFMKNIYETIGDDRYGSELAAE